MRRLCLRRAGAEGLSSLSSASRAMPGCATNGRAAARGMSTAGVAMAAVALAVVLGVRPAPAQDTPRELRQMLDHKDSPYIRAVSTQHPAPAQGLPCLPAPAARRGQAPARGSPARRLCPRAL